MLVAGASGHKVVIPLYPNFSGGVPRPWTLGESMAMHFLAVEVRWAVAGPKSVQDLWSSHSRLFQRCGFGPSSSSSSSQRPEGSASSTQSPMPSELGQPVAGTVPGPAHTSNQTSEFVQRAGRSGWRACSVHYDHKYAKKPDSVRQVLKEFFLLMVRDRVAIVGGDWNQTYHALPPTSISFRLTFWKLGPLRQAWCCYSIRARSPFLQSLGMVWRTCLVMVFVILTLLATILW